MALEHVVIRDYRSNRSGRYIRRNSPVDRLIRVCRYINIRWFIYGLLIIFIGFIFYYGITRTYVSGYGWVESEKAMRLFEQITGGGLN